MQTRSRQVDGFVRPAGATRPVRVGDTVVGGSAFTLVAGPCAIESREQLLTTAQAVAGAGATLLRGGIFKLRTDPQSFQGLGLDALDAVREARARTGLGFVAEVTDPRQIEALAGAVDMYQVGARNMHNYDLLKELGRAAKPVLLKRGFCALIEEWLLAARYVTDAGNPDVVLCERGIRTFERATRNTLDLAAVALVKAGSPYPVLVDPSHGTGRPEIVPAMCLAAAAAGADGLMLEVHPEPERALSDGYQALSLGAFAALVPPLESLLGHLGRPLARARQRLAG